MRQYREIDENGLFVRDILLDENPNPDRFIDVEDFPYEGGLFHPKFDGEKWVEGKSKEEVENIRKTIEEQYRRKPPTEEEQMRADIDYIAIMTGVDLYE